MMIIDIHAHPEKCRKYRVLDAVTGEDLTGLSIFYADDEAGVLGVLKKDANGIYAMNETGDEVAKEWICRPIKIVL